MNFSQMRDKIIASLASEHESFDNRSRLLSAMNKMIERTVGVLSGLECLALLAATPEARAVRPRAPDFCPNPSAADMARQAVTDALRDAVARGMIDVPELARISWAGSIYERE